MKLPVWSLSVLVTMADKNAADGAMRLILERNRKQEDDEFQEWYAALLTLPEDYRRELKEGWLADVELQPLRWMNLGLTLIQSPKVLERVQLADGVQGPALSAILLYPIFQSGTEVFLKGMWLCQYADCRLFDSSSYVSCMRRDEIRKELQKTLGHDLLHIITALQEIPQYKAEETLSRFLNGLGALVRRDYYPALIADVRRDAWAFVRYPKRFYDDNRKEGAADNYSRYSPQPFIERLFRKAERRIDELWGLGSGLSAKQR